MFKIYNGAEYFYQYDLGQKIIVEGDYCKVHFCNQPDGNALASVVYEQDGTKYADVPNELLHETNNIRVYGICADGEGLINTHCYQVFKVIARGKPEDYVFTDDDMMHWQTLAEEFYAAIGDINSALEELHTYAQGVIAGGVA